METAHKKCKGFDKFICAMCIRQDKANEVRLVNTLSEDPDNGITYCNLYLKSQGKF
jgi:hypothetical protein